MVKYSYLKVNKNNTHTVLHQHYIIIYFLITVYLYYSCSSLLKHEVLMFFFYHKWITKGPSSSAEGVWQPAERRDTTVPSVVEMRSRQG